MLHNLLTIPVCAFDPNDVARAVLEELLHLSLHERVRNRHPREALLSTVSPRHRVATEPRHKAQVETELVNEPVNSGGTLICKHLREVGSLRTATNGVRLENL